MEETVGEIARDVAGEAGFAAFFAAEYETVLRAMYLLCGDRYEAEELTQAAFVKACERWDRIRTMGNPSGYVYRAAVNARTSSFRRIRVAARRVFATRPTDPISESDERDRIRRALARLPSGQRAAVVLVEWLDLSDVDAGRILGISAGAVRVRLSRARASLRDTIESEDP